MTTFADNTSLENMIYLTIVAAPRYVEAFCEAAYRTQKVSYCTVPEPMPGNTAYTKVRLILQDT